MAETTYPLPVVKRYIEAICRPFFKAFQDNQTQRITDLEEQIAALKARVEALETQ